MKFDPDKHLLESSKGRTMATRRTLPDGSEDWALEAIPGMECCDFCTETPVVRGYDARPFIDSVIETDSGTMTNVSADGWGACAECARLIDADDREALADRSIELLVRKNAEVQALVRRAPHVRALMRRDIRATHEGFFNARKS